MKIGLGTILKVLKIFTFLSGKKRIIAIVGLIISGISQTHPDVGDSLTQYFTPEVINATYDWIFGFSTSLGLFGTATAMNQEFIDERSKKETE